MNRLLLSLSLLLLLPGAVFAQASFAGSYALEAPDGQSIVVRLSPASSGSYAGTLTKGPLEWQLSGEVDEDALVGTMTTDQGTLAFEAYTDGAQLELILAGIGADGMPDVDNAEQLVFTRFDGAAAARVAAGGEPDPVSEGADPYVGTFTDGTLTLHFTLTNGTYRGHLAVGAEAHPVVAHRVADGLEGMMTAPTGEYGLRVTAGEGNSLILHNAGQQFHLRRTATGTASAYGQPAAGAPARQPAAAPAQPVANDPLAAEWRQHLAGKKVTYISSYSSNSLGGGGMSTKNIYHLCSDGSFVFSDDSSISIQNEGSPDLGRPGAATRGSGTWRILTQGQVAGIELRYHGGEASVYQLEYRDGATFADGSRVYVTPGEVCR